MRRLPLAVLLLSLAFPALAQGDAPLDGTKWKMKFRAAKTIIPVWKGDEMTFENGRFRDRECQSYGFEPSTYAGKQQDGRTIWTSTQFNADGERTEWKGELNGDRMEGTLEWLRPDGRSHLYKFKASRHDES